MADPVAAMCEQLIKAVNVMMDAESNQRYRLEALKFCEEFKEKCPFCVPCGLQLSDKSQAAVVRHFGLQILEHVIKFQWNSMPQQDKVHLKNCTMELLKNGTYPILEEESHIKDALSRIVVEMIKREWPQHWPDMLKEMETLTSFGDTQTELVMLILLRLAEDVITFQTLPMQRRRDIQQTLTQNMDGIFTFLLTILQQHVDEYRRLKRLPGHELKAKAHCRVGIATLNTLAGYIDWVALIHITNENCHLLEILCLLLSEPELQLEAAECLLIAISRKGKLEDRKPLMLLFDDVAMHYILSAAQSADGTSITGDQPEGTGHGETRYTFLKRLCQVLCALGSQLCALVGSIAEVEVPGNLNKYMEAFLAFTTHPSQFLRSSTLTTWGNVFRHEVLSKDPVIVQMAIKYLKATTTNLVKTGFPSKNDSPACEYARVDFDSDEDFNAFFNSFRAQQGEVIRPACKIAPLEAFQVAGEWLQYQINTPLDTGNSKSGEGFCSVLSPSVVQWDAMTFFTESVMGQLFKILDKEKLPVDQGMELLQAVVNYETRDPLILSCVLSNLSTLFPFILHQPQFLPKVFYKLFPSITFEIVEESKAPRTRAVKNVRRHACSSITKMCRDYPDFMMPCFDMLYMQVKKLFANELLLTQMEKSALMEALVLLSNQFKDYSKQKAFLEEHMASVTARWLSGEMRSVLWDPASFLAFVGTDQVINEPGSEDQMGINRSRISFCVYTILGVVKRARWPTDLEEAKAGGFVVGYTSAGLPIYRNPCTEPLLALLPNLLALIRTHNSLYLPENQARLSETFKRAYDVMDVEKNLILAIPQPVLDVYDSPVYKSSLERMQGFFCTLYDNCYHVLGNAGPALQQDFYTIEGLAEKLLGSALIHLEHVPDHRLRPLLRVFMKPLVTSCPPEYYDSLLCPLLGLLFSHLLQRLNLRWQIINQRTSVCGPDEDECSGESQVTQEMLEERLVRLVTREVLDLLTVSCIARKLPEAAGNREDADGDEERMATDSSQLNVSQTADELTELGKCFLQHEDMYMTLLAISFNSLSWRDTTNCQRAATLVCWALLRQVVGGNLLPEAVTWLYASVLSALQMHGQHDGCNAALTQLALLIYDALRPRYVELRAIMNQIPNIHPEHLEQFDQKTVDPMLQKVGEKKRKDQFKKLIAGTVGKPLGQQFKKEVHIRNLPSLFKKAKPSKDIVSDSTKAGLVELFSPEHDDH
ncbi:exportin-5 isoform X2 [Electrophorus electricus]|uniref:exportin-5 isoform X2 n=1 Tax=Electrophorus electricus TaxID=8005 RepID=UPI000F0A96C9|nr:exportin-5 isoform X2 [Electrophorus electricus]